MPYVVRAFPLVRPVDDLRAFAAELAGNQNGEAGRFYRNYGVRHESWHLQATPNGNWVIAVTLVDDPGEAASRYAGASEAFHAWFKEQVLHCTGVDPNVTPLGPPTTQIFAWSADEG